MGKGLSREQLDTYERDGYLSPIPIYSETEMASFRRKLDDLQAKHSEATKKIDLKAHLVCPWLDEMIRNEIMLDVVESIFGAPDILCWTSSFRFKRAHSPSYAGWHQDTMYIKVEPAVTFWLAFTEAGPENGGMRVIPGSHRGTLLPHRDTQDKNSILTRGQYITVPVDETKAVDVSLRPGEAAIFNHNLIHGSKGNPSNRPRTIFLPSYMPTWAIIKGARDCAALVRGEDRYRNFEHEPRCPGEMTPAAIEAHRRAVEYSAATMYKDASHAPIALS
ncbi:MAG: phytanoyl-CoA dioxygenase family protein [Alphaproteobacteria bacterium]